MRGLTQEERDVLRDLADDVVRMLTDDSQDDVHARLVERGLARTWVTSNFEPHPGAIPDADGFVDGLAWDTHHWAITDDGRLALRVCTVAP